MSYFGGIVARHFGLTGFPGCKQEGFLVTIIRFYLQAK